MRTNDIKKWEEKIKRVDLKYKTKTYIYDFQQYETVRSFGESIYTQNISIVEAQENQSNLLKNIVEFNDKSRPKNKEVEDKKEILIKVHMLFMKVKN